MKKGGEGLRIVSGERLTLFKEGELKMKKNINIFYLLILSFFFVLVLAACNPDPGAGEQSSKDGEGDSGEAKQGGDFVISSTANPTMFNEFYATDSPSNLLAKFMYDSLIKVDENLEPQPSLATDWEYSDEDKKYTFNLREDVTWHDGEKFTADDVVFSYSIALHEDYTGARTSYFSSIEKIEATDDYTVEITFNTPDAKLLPIALAFNVLPEHILGDVPNADLANHDFNTKNPIGTGPFKFDEWKQGQYVRFVANDDYWDGRPNFDSITSKIVSDSNAQLAQFEAGDIHFLKVSEENVSTAQQFVDQGKADITVTPTTSYSYIGYNLENPLFESKKVRQALTHALDRQAMVDSVINGNGEIANHPGLPFSWAFNEDVPTFDYDPEKAKELLAEEGWEENSDGILEKDGLVFEFELKTNQGNKVREKLMAVAQEQWAEVGVKANLKIVEMSALSAELNEKKFDANMGGWGLRDDPSLSPYFHSDEIEKGFNRGSYSNPELDKVIDQGDEIIDPEERVQYLEESQAIVAEDQPYTFLYYPNANIIYSTNVDNVLSHPGNEFYNIHKWTME